MDLFNDQYRMPGVRWTNGSAATYFVSAYTHDRSHAFGTIANQTMVRSPLGEAARACLQAIPGHFPHAFADTFVVMPDQIHAIIVVAGVAASSPVADVRPQLTCFAPPLRTANRFGSHGHDLASIVSGFKGAVAKYASEHAIPFVWQSRHHDTIIRDAAMLDRVRQYIIDKPRNRGT